MASKTALHDAIKPLGCLNILFVTKADEFVPHVGAASILAKFNRDIEMNLLDKKFPGYYFNKNAGYGTAEHIEALATLGPVPHVHRPEK
jgi:ribonuclease HII